MDPARADSEIHARGCTCVDDMDSRFILILLVWLLWDHAVARAATVPPDWVPRIAAADMMYAPTDVGVKYMCVSHRPLTAFLGSSVALNDRTVCASCCVYLYVRVATLYVVAGLSLAMATSAQQLVAPTPTWQACSMGSQMCLRPTVRACNLTLPSPSPMPT